MQKKARQGSAVALRAGVLVLTAIVATATPGRASSNACVWTGTTSSDWTDATNWTDCGNLAPQSADTAEATAGTPNVPAIPVAATVTVAGLTIDPGVILDVDGTLSLGDLNGVGMLRVHGTLNWTTGTMSGSGTTQIAAGGILNISGSDPKTIQTRSVQNGGTIHWSGGSLEGEFTTFQNVAGGVFDIQGDLGFTSFAYQFLNSGTLQKSGGAGTATFQTTIKNFGTVQASSGTLALDGAAGSTSDGTFVAAPGGTLAFSAGTQTLSALSSVSGAGTVLFSGGDIDLLGSYAVSGTTSITGGIARFDADATTAALLLSGGSLQGTGALTVTASGIWTGGAMNDAGLTKIAGSATFTIAGPAAMSLAARTIENSGSVVWTGGDVHCGQGGGFHNLLFATFDVQSDQTMAFDLGGARPIFRNEGTVKKTADLAGATVFSVFFDNLEILEADAGTMSFEAFTQTLGQTKLNGGTLAAGPLPLTIQSGDLVGSGTIVGDLFNGGDVLPGGSPGTIEVQGNYVQSEQGRLDFDLNGTGAGEFDQLKVTGTITLSGVVAVTTGFSPAPGDSFPVVVHDAGDALTGHFRSLPDGAVLGAAPYRVHYAAADGNAVVLTYGPTVAASFLTLDSSASAASDGDGIFEPGETDGVFPRWENKTGSGVPLTGVASGFGGPAGAAYGVSDGSASYGTIPVGGTSPCSDCFTLSISAPASRPAPHWDATFTETPSTTDPPKVWTLHIGDSFTDVPRSQPFYKRIEVLLHHGITTGCAAGLYCPGDPVSRAQMAIFIAKALAGGGPQVASSGVAPTGHYVCGAGGVSVFSDVAPEDAFCRHVHFLADQNITLGCSAGQYCPSANVNRGDMAIFIAKAVAGSGPAVPVTYGPDPVTGFSYSCAAGSPNLHFADVAVSDAFCKHVHYLWALGIVTGCSASEYCPAGGVTRDAMAKFLASAFHLALDGS